MEAKVRNQRVLVAVITCDRDRPKNEAQRDTCFADIHGADVRFFFGRGVAQNPDEVMLDVEDDYKNLPDKVSHMLKWALDQGYDYIFRMDSDVYVVMERLMANIPIGHDYCGRLRGPSGTYPAPYASGFAYWLSAKAALVRCSSTTEDIAEDRATGNILMQAGIKCKPDYRYAVVTSVKNAKSAVEGPRKDNDLIAACEFSAEGLYAAHQQYLHSPSMPDVDPMPTGTPYSDICVLVKTLLRDKMMMRCVDLIEKHLPGAKIVIMDDGMETKEKVSFYAQMRRKGHVAAWLPFDSGFGAKSNAAMEYYDRPYVLIYSDDFEANEKVAEDVLKMKRVLELVPKMAVASGRVDDNPYEGYITEGIREDGSRDVILVPISVESSLHGSYIIADGIEYLPCDLTVNYNLVKTEVLKKCKWDEDFKIGGDHYDFYKQVKDMRYGVCYVNGVSISQMKRFAGSEDPMYAAMRGRARFSLPEVFRKHNWASFTMLDGTRDTPETVQAWVDKHTQVQTVTDGRINKSGLRKSKREQRSQLRKERHQRIAPNGERIQSKDRSDAVRRHPRGGPTMAKEGVRPRKKPLR